MSTQITNNNCTTASTSSNPYTTRKLNNIDEAKAFKEKQDNWTRLYHKMLKEIEAMIDIQKQVQNMIKIAKETTICHKLHSACIFTTSRLIFTN